jgi:hypothetical protein
VSSLLLELTLLIYLEIQAIVLKFWEYLVNQQDEIPRAYINLGPYQPLMSKYPLTGEKHPRRFQSHWFKSYPWLEYSEKNTAFCFPCYLFPSKPLLSG